MLLVRIVLFSWKEFCPFQSRRESGKEENEGPRTVVGVATFDSTIHFYSKTCIAAVTSEVPSTPLPQVAEQAKYLHINILYSYRKFCASASASGQLILPEALKLLPLYTLGLLKSCGLRADRRVDDRSFWINYVPIYPLP